MADNGDNTSLGNDGSWFLEAVGAITPTPTASETIAELFLDNKKSEVTPDVSTISTTVVSTTFDGDTGSSTSSFEPPRESIAVRTEITGEFDTPVLLPKQPEVENTSLAPVLETRRPFRLSVLFMIVLLIAAAGVTSLWIPQYQRSEASALKLRYAESAQEMRVHLPDAQGALDVITDPSSTLNELTAVIPLISRIDSLSSELSLLVSTDVPQDLPIVGNDEIENIAPLRVRAQMLAAQASDIARQLGYTYEYRSIVPHLLDTGSLPTSGDNQTINSLSISLASSLVENSTAIADLPAYELTSGVRETTESSFERYASWQDEYLAALLEGDVSGATALIGEINTLKTALNSELAAAMGVVRVEVDKEIVELAGELEALINDLTAP